MDWNILIVLLNYLFLVASFTDAWIETTSPTPVEDEGNESHLLQMRGLKQLRLRVDADRNSRIFYRCVDWNPFTGKMAGDLLVASFTDAWIETSDARLQRPQFLVASFTDAWIETHCEAVNKLTNGRIFYRCVDWNPSTTAKLQKIQSHLLQMRGLKRLWNQFGKLSLRRIFYRCVDWNVNESGHTVTTVSRIFYRCVDWNLPRY